MDLLYCDESNLEHREGDFLLYGGILIPGHQAGALSNRIDQLRKSAGMAPDARLKFNPTPEGMSHEDFRSLKQKIIEAATEHECKLLTCVVLHDLASDPHEARRFGINTVCYHYHCALSRMNKVGVVFIDRFNDDGNKIEGHLKDRMSTGVNLSYKNDPTRLSSIVGFHYSAIGQSHFTSLIDILLGSFRFAMNARCRGEAKLHAAARMLLGLLAPLFYSRYEDQICDMGIHFSPMRVKVGRYRSQYVDLQSFWSAEVLSRVSGCKHHGLHGQRLLTGMNADV